MSEYTFPVICSLCGLIYNSGVDHDCKPIFMRTDPQIIEKLDLILSILPKTYTTNTTTTSDATIISASAYQAVVNERDALKASREAYKLMCMESDDEIAKLNEDRKVLVEALKLVANKHPECFCMDHAGISNNALKKVGEVGE